MPKKFAVLCTLIVTSFYWSCSPNDKAEVSTTEKSNAETVWHAPDTSLIPFAPEGKLIRYGRELIVHTSRYLGPKGKVKAITNGMNCQNCHLNAGTKPFGNNYGSVASLYPKFRARSGSEETIEKRINDCIERSLNGIPLDAESKEMQAIKMYITWVGSNVKKGEKANGSGLKEIDFLDRTSDTVKGKQLFIAKCKLCHGQNGEGLVVKGLGEYIYPPLWGENSYNQSAGLYRVSMLAKYIHANMPWGARYDSTLLTVEEAWDISAYINSRQRPTKQFPNDWPKIETKPFDHPFGPYADSFTEEQHKFGPFEQIVKATKVK